MTPSQVNVQPRLAPIVQWVLARETEELLNLLVRLDLFLVFHKNNVNLNNIMDCLCPK